MLDGEFAQALAHKAHKAVGALIGVAAPAISNGTSNISISEADGNITVTRGGTLNTTFDSTGVVIEGNLTVKGNTTTINSTTVSVDDINIVLGDTASPTDTSANGGGITLKGTTDKTITYNNSTGIWCWNVRRGGWYHLKFADIDALQPFPPQFELPVDVSLLGLE